MITSIKKLLFLWLARYPRLKEWLWFVTLWLGGLLGVILLTYPLKLLIKWGS